MAAFDHSGKVIAVTGGSRGIGEAIVRRLCAEGASVFATYNAQPERAASITADITSSGGTVVYQQVDVSNEEQAKGFIESVVQQGGRIDGLVNNAGVTKDGLIMRMSAADWDTVLDTNLKGVFLTCRAACRPSWRAAMTA